MSTHSVKYFWRIGRSWEQQQWNVVSQLPDIVLNAIMGEALQYPLPSENIIVPGRAPVIQMGRYWMMVFGKTNNWDHLLEVYENWGDDGHVDYRLIGFARVDDSQLKTFLAAVRACSSAWKYPRIEYEPFLPKPICSI